MSAEWKGNLRNTGTDVLIDTALLILIVCANIPQISQLRKRTSTRGISPSYILFNVLFSNVQLSQLLLMAAYAWPNDVRPVLESIGNGNLGGLAAFGAVLGLLQVFVLWLCSVVVLMSFAAKSPRRHMSIPAFLHAAAVLGPAVAFALPNPSRRTFGKGIVMALTSMSNRTIAPCSILLQFYAQFREIRAQNGEPGALSLLSIGLQIPTIAALGFRWSLRIGNPTWTHGSAPVGLWYEWGFPAVNCLAHAVGCGFLLICYLFATRGTVAQADLEDRAPLLG